MVAQIASTVPVSFSTTVPGGSGNTCRAQMKHLALVVIVLSTAWPSPSAQVKCEPTVTGSLRIEAMPSATYGDTRTIRIWLPSGYNPEANAKERYPVLYMFDGQTLFDSCTAFSGEQELQIDETVTRLIQDSKIPPMIIVGMDSNSRRSHEYRPYRDNIADPTGPEPIGRQLPAAPDTDAPPAKR